MAAFGYYPGCPGAVENGATHLTVTILSIRSLAVAKAFTPTTGTARPVIDHKERITPIIAYF